MRMQISRIKSHNAIQNVRRADIPVRSSPRIIQGLNNLKRLGVRSRCRQECPRAEFLAAATVNYETLWTFNTSDDSWLAADRNVRAPGWLRSWAEFGLT